MYNASFWRLIVLVALLHSRMIDASLCMTSGAANCTSCLQLANFCNWCPPDKAFAHKGVCDNSHIVGFCKKADCIGPACGHPNCPALPTPVMPTPAAPTPKAPTPKAPTPAAPPTPATPTLPQLRGVVAQRGLDKVRDIGVPLVNELLAAGAHLPDIHDDTHVPEPIGHITLDLTNITISKFHLSGAAVDFGAPSSAVVEFGPVAFVLSLDYKWRKVNSPHASDHGVVTATPKAGSTITTTQRFSVVDGQPHATVLSTKVHMSFDIHFDGNV